MNQYKEESEKIIQEVENKIEKENRLNPTLIWELMSKEFGDIEWVAEPLIPKEAITILSGDPASFKTWLILDLAKTIAEGGLWLGYFLVQKQNVLIIDEENSERLLHKRFKELNLDPSLSIYLLSLKNFQLVDEDINCIIDFVKEKDIKVIFFDSLIRIHSSDENDAVKMAKVFSQLKKFCIEGLSIILSHHNRKENTFNRGRASQSMRGSSDILAAVDAHISVSKDDDFLKIEQTKLRQAEECAPFKVDIVKDDEKLSFQYAGEIDEVKQKRDEAKIYIQNLLSETTEVLNKTQIKERVKGAGADVGDKSIDSALNEMISEGIIFTSKSGKRSILCSLKPFEVNQTQLINN